MLTDVHMRELNGIDATQQIVAQCPGTSVLAFTGWNDPGLVPAMLEAGARGFLHKICDLQRLDAAIHTVAAGEQYLDEWGNEGRGHPLARAGTPEEMAARLSPREREVLQLIAEGHQSAGDRGTSSTSATRRFRPTACT